MHVCWLANCILDYSTTSGWLVNCYWKDLRPFLTATSVGPLRDSMGLKRSLPCNQTSPFTLQTASLAPFCRKSRASSLWNVVRRLLMLMYILMLHYFKHFSCAINIKNNFLIEIWTEEVYKQPLQFTGKEFCRYFSEIL